MERDTQVAPEVAVPGRPFPFRLAIGFLAAAAALGTSLALAPYLEGELVSALFLVAVFVGVRQGGLAGGVLAILLSAIAFDWLPAGPHALFFPQGQGNRVRLAVFLGISAFIVYSVHRQQMALLRAAESEKRATDAAERLAGEVEQRQVAERRAEEQARHLETVLGGLQDAVLSVDASGRITYLNGLAMDMLSLRPEDCLGQPLAEKMTVFDEASGASVVPTFARVLETGIARRNEGLRALQVRDGRRIPIDVSASPLLDTDGRLLGAVTIVRDVTEQRAAEQALRASEERFRLATEAGTMGVWLWRPETGEVTWNGTLSAMLHMGDSDYQGPDMAFFERVLDADLPGLRATLETAMRSRSGFQHEFRVVLPDGTQRWLVTAGRPVLERSLESGAALAGVTFDITDRRQAEQRILALNRDLEILTQQLQETNGNLRQRTAELEAVNAAKTKFLSNMSHELRTPLNTICGFVELLLEQDAGELNDRQTRYLRNIDASARHLIRVVSDVLDLSRIAAGRVQIHPEPFALAELVEEAVTAFSPMAAEHGVALHAEVVGPLEARADRQRMRQVLSNLLSNAIKFTPAGGEVRVEAEQRTGCLELRVTDTGIGIPEPERERIFEEFEQVHHPEFRPIERGSGLGLAITRQLIQLQGGKVEVESKVGSGSTFRVMLPCARAEATGE